MASPSRPPAPTPRSPPHSDFSFHVDPLQHPSDPSVVPGQNDISISAVEPSSPNAMAPLPTSSLSSTIPAPRIIPPVPKFSPDNSSMGPPPPANPNAPVRGVPGHNDLGLQPSISEAMPPPLSSGLRKLPPVPKFSPSKSVSMISPDSKSSDFVRRQMFPSAVPKFQNSSGEIKAMGPPASRVPPKVSPSSQPSSEESSTTHEQSASAEDKIEAAGLPGVSSINSPQGNGRKQAGDMSFDSDTLALEAGVGVNEVTVQDGAVAVEGENLPVDDEGSSRTLHAAAGSAGVSAIQPPYLKPAWSAIPGQPYTLEILKEGNILGLEDVSKKGAYMFGRSDRCDFALEHPTVSRYHAVLQYNAKGESFLYDLGSTHGTFINKLQVKGKAYVPLHVGDIVRFGYSSRLYAFQGPLSLMPMEGLSRNERQVQRVVEAAQDRAIREASLIRGKRDSLAADGISWGMQEDAEEEEEDNAEEITWQTFKGELTEKQQKTLDKIHKHNEKLSNLKKENDAIQAKEISQGGLTQGQQTQVARNDQRMEQLVEELESMEETLNESIQESINGRTGRKRGAKKNPFGDEEEDEDLSDDEFYDRASKLHLQKRKETLHKVETAESLLDKKVVLTAEIETLREAVKAEEEQTASFSQESSMAKKAVEADDPLDQFMTNLSSTILKDRASHLQKELESLIKELERVERLLKIADPTGEGLKRWELKKSVEGKQQAEALTSKPDIRVFSTKEGAQELASTVGDLKSGQDHIVSQESSLDPRDMTIDSHSAVKQISLKEDCTVLPGLEPPLRLGAPIPENSEDMKVEYSDKVNEEAVNFITYKDRKKVNNGRDKVSVAELVQDVEQPNISEKKAEVSVVDGDVADSVALLLRHKRGLVAADTDVSQNTEHDTHITSTEEKPHLTQSSKKRKKQGPAKPSYLIDTDNVEDWAPPAGQTGDGRTALNDKYGY